MPGDSCELGRRPRSSLADWIKALVIVDKYGLEIFARDYPKSNELHKDAKERHPDLGACPSPSDYTDLKSEHIYHILDTPQAITRATRAVLSSFEDDGCVYLELRTTPRRFPGSSTDSFQEYLDAVFRGIDHNHESKMMVRLILTVNWDFGPDKVKQIIDLAITARNAGRSCVVGIDIAGNPQNSIFRTASFTSELVKAKVNGLKLTIHFAEKLVSILKESVSCTFCSLADQAILIQKINQFEADMSN
ncbi:hypothetical protein PSTT_10912 [Puccinia striiformis]|uniref:Adenosine deaminase domain-containing protein n=1 Tax=Puccinia striiformis TaxID=27350 RepID=A0A2S4V2G2_9BASI|nr:hypothetical protein PSTT_10912 [Puccinia striiformis]